MMPPDELVRRGIAPAPIHEDALGFLPPDRESAVVIPPILTESGDGDTLAERLAFPVPARQNRPAASKFCGIPIPPKYRRLPWYLLIPALALSRRGIGYSLSVIFHLALFIFLGTLVFQRHDGRFGEPVDASFAGPDAFELVDSVGSSTESIDVSQLLDQQVLIAPKSDSSGVSETMTQTLLTEGVAPSFEEEPLAFEPLAGSAEELPFRRKGITGGRTAVNRRQGLPGREGETNEASEMAVERGLRWLALHQLPDGGWSFDLGALDDNDRKGSCGGQCSNSLATSSGAARRYGLYPSRTAATGIALLPFLGAGYTHRSENPYQETISHGLEYLKYHVRATPDGFDFREWGERYGMYTQAIVVLTLCEAYEMTEDTELRKLAAEGLKFIEASQRDDGGWRYEAAGDSNFFPHIPGDTSVSGWQMLALKSGVSAGFELQPETLYKVAAFLDTVGVENQSQYKYQCNTTEAEEKRHGTTAVGLLMREYLGWGPNQKGIKKGTGHLGRWFGEMNDDYLASQKGNINSPRGPFFRDQRYVYNLYYAYYASLALHHIGGKEWKKSFPATRDFLIATQSSGALSRHESGSWLFYDHYLNDGGRLLNTALSVLILETPYRYLPMYR